MAFNSEDLLIPLTDAGAGGCGCQCRIELAGVRAKLSGANALPGFMSAEVGGAAKTRAGSRRRFSVSGSGLTGVTRAP